MPQIAPEKKNIKKKKIEKRGELANTQISAHILILLNSIPLPFLMESGITKKKAVLLETAPAEDNAALSSHEK